VKIGGSWVVGRGENAEGQCSKAFRTRPKIRLSMCAQSSNKLKLLTKGLKAIIVAVGRGGPIGKGLAQPFSRGNLPNVPD